MPLDLESLQLLDAIARRGSFAGAAAELGRVPSAVTHAVRRLEAEIAVPLFDRSGYRARLTAAGEELLREGRQLLAAADDLAHRVRRVAQGWEAELRIALDTLIPFERLAPLLSQFLAAAPTQLRFTHEVLGGTWDALVTGRADLALGAAHDGPGEPIGGGGFRSAGLGQVEFVFAVARDHPLAAHAPPVPLAELQRHRQVVVGDTSRRLAPRAAGLIGLREVLTVPSMPAKIAAQAAGLGVGYVPRHLARAALASGELVEIATEHSRGDDGRTTLRAAWRADARGRALGWWVDVLARPEVRAVLLA